MAMDDRQKQIREGAGLEESRLNVEFIELLKKYSTPLLLVVTVIAGGYFLYNRYKLARERALDQAFSQLEAARTSRNPVSLGRVAEEQTSFGQIADLARLAAADLHLEAARSWIPPGISLEDDGTLPEGTEFLNEEQRAEQLTKSAAAFQTVADSADARRRVLPMLSAVCGLAAVAECRADWDKARSYYDQVKQQATSSGFTSIANMADERNRSLDALKTAPRLYTKAELPVPPTPDPLPGASSAPFTIPGLPGTLQRIEGLPPGFTPPAAPPADSPAPVAPAPTPAPAPTTPEPKPAPTEPAPAPATPPATEPK